MKETVRQFTERLRKKQSYYRVNVLHIEECGIGPTEHSKNTHPNMLIKGEVTGKNFLNDQIFEYAKYRVEKKGTPGHKHETIDAYFHSENYVSVRNTRDSGSAPKSSPPLQQTAKKVV